MCLRASVVRVHPRPPLFLAREYFEKERDLLLVKFRIDYFSVRAWNKTSFDEFTVCGVLRGAAEQDRSA